MFTNWYRQSNVLVAAGVFIVALSVYCATLAPTTSFWDCGEFITTSHIVGVPHQPGTPLYVLVGRVFDILIGNADITQPALRTAWAINFMSAFFSALAVMFIYLIIRELARRADPDSGWLAQAGGVVGAGFLAFSDTFWGNAVEAEVYGLAACMLSLLTWLAIRWYDHRDNKGSDPLLMLIVYLLGLGVGFHLGTLLVYPGIFLLVLLSRKRELPVTDLYLMSAGLALFLFSTITANNGLIVGLLAIYGLVVMVRSFQGYHFATLGSLLFLFGLSVHFIMMIRAGATPEPSINQTAPADFSTLLSVIRREQYPPINPFERQAPILWQFGYYYKFLIKQFYFLGNGTNFISTVSTVLGPIFLAMVGLFHGLRRLRILILVPLVNYLINGEILTLYLNFTNHEVRDRDYFYFAAFMFMAVFIGLGAAAILRYLVGSEGKSADQLSLADVDWRKSASKVKTGLVPKAVAGLLILIMLFPAFPGHSKFYQHDRSENTIARDYAWNILAGLDKDAILFTNGDNDTFPIWFLQAVEHFRTDVTVVNLSLVNLPWYVKQLKHDEQPLALTRSDTEIDNLRHRILEDPTTKKRTIVMIKDYVLHDIMKTNREQAINRPVFFAVTIPQDNMARYFPMLQMEGMAYRLTDKASDDNMPIVDAEKVMENMLGTYDLSSILSDDSTTRHSVFKEIQGKASDSKNITIGQTSDLPIELDFSPLSEHMGSVRKDVFRNANTSNLLGNYPAAFNRAGFAYYLKANSVATTDTVRYKKYLNNSLAAFESSLAVFPYNDQAVEFYPLLLVQAFRDQDAKDFLSSLDGNVSRELEERIVFNSLRGIVRGGLSELAIEWIDERIELFPQREFYYQVKFALHQALSDLVACREVILAMEEQFGRVEQQMRDAFDDLSKRALSIEEQPAGNVGGDNNGR